MKNSRVINPSDIRLFYFGSRDVLTNDNEKEARRHKLQRATILSNCEHIPVNLHLQLPNGEQLETESDLLGYAEDYVILKGGIYIPVRTIVDVDI